VSDDEASLALWREAFQGVPLHDLLGVDVVEVGDGHAVMEIALEAGALSAVGTLHGGAIAVLCDISCAAAASLVPSVDHATHALVTADLHVRYLGRARTGPIRADARVRKAGRALIVVEAEVTDGEGTLVAVADMSASLVPRPGGPST
jgi:uncharacterized protein (TIGR00369 family)